MKSKPTKVCEGSRSNPMRVESSAKEHATIEVDVELPQGVTPRWASPHHSQQIPARRTPQ